MDVSCCFFESGSKVEDVEFPLLLLLHLLFSAVLSLHADNPGLEILLNALHDHAGSADLALTTHECDLASLLQCLSDQFDGFVDVYMLDSLELGLLDHWLHLSRLRHQYQSKKQLNKRFKPAYQPHSLIEYYHHIWS